MVARRAESPRSRPDERDLRQQVETATVHKAIHVLWITYPKRQWFSASSTSRALTTMNAEISGTGRGCGVGGSTQDCGCPQPIPIMCITYDSPESRMRGSDAFLGAGAHAQRDGLLGFGEEVVALVVDDDEGREVLDLDLPHRFHAQLGVL